jgi:hypothetical protein
MGAKLSGRVREHAAIVLARDQPDEMNANLLQVPICTVETKNRQTFKDCCKYQDKESLIGHCR